MAAICVAILVAMVVPFCDSLHVLHVQEGPSSLVCMCFCVTHSNLHVNNS